MSLGHVCFADMLPSTPAASNQVKNVAANFYANDDAIRQCSSLIRSSRDRSVSPNTVNSPTPRYIRNMGFFRQLSRRFGLRSNDDLIYTTANDDDNQSSSTDSCSSTQAAAAAVVINKGRELQQQSLQTNDSHISGTSSETSSTMDDIDEPTTQTDSNEQQQSQQQKQEVNKQLSYNSRASFSRLQRRSTSTIRKALAGFSLTTRSLSCSGAPPAQPHNECDTPSSASSTPIKSALKSSSNLELNKKTLTNHCTHQLKPAAALNGKSNKKVKPPPQRILRQPVSYTYLKGISGLPTQRVPRNSVCCQYARH
uniref:DUF4797 domain-containing protein n=1 Tax=Glossina morsitans morsitans TaxID=37546 RepID=A0A1B0FBM8_GLOMM